jgi:hypothetical protein
MAIKFYGGHQLNPKTQLFGTKTALRTIEVDVDGNVVSSTTSSTSNDVSLLLDASATADGSVVDSSTNSHAITVNGDVTQSSFSPYRSGGYSLYNTGTNHIEKTGLTPPGTGDFTVEAWVYVTDSSANQLIWDTRPIAVDNNTGINVQFRSNNVLYAGTHNLGYITGPTTFNDNEWVHVALVRSGGTLTLYGNGVSQGSVSNSVNLTSTDITIGSNRGSYSVFNGYIRDLRVVNDAVYTGDFTPPTSPLTSISNTALLTCNLPYVSSDLTITGDVYPKPFSPYDYVGYSESLHGGSYVFDGNGDYLTSSNENGDFSFGTGDFTVETWAYYKTMPSGNGYPASAWILGGGPTNSNTGFDIAIGSTNIQVGLSSFLNLNINAPHGISAGEWYHIAIVRNGSDLSFYRNGTLIVSADVSGVTSDDMSTGIAVGAAEPSGAVSGNPNAIYSDVRVVKGTAVYTTDFIPSTAPLEAVTGTSLLLSGNNAAIRDESQSVESISVFGNTTVVEDSPYGTGKSMTFDGNGDYLTLNGSSIDFETGDFTVEAFVYHTGDNDDTIISDSTGFTFTYGYGGKLRFYHANGSDIVDATANFISNRWVHVAVVRSNNILTFYQDGNAVGSHAYNVDIGTNSSTTYVGKYFGGTIQDFEGKISDLRIVKGTAVYTENFSVPTAPFDGATPEVPSQVSLHLNGTDSGIVDSSSNSHALTINGDVAVVSGSPHDSTTSMSFDGNGDYISIADHDDFNFGSGDFTVEMWINAATQSTNWPGIFSGSDYNAAGSASLRFDNVGHDNKLFLYTNGLGDPALTTANTLSHNTWHHIALVRSGTSLSFYVNGTQDGTTTISSGQTFDFSVGEFRIGRGFDVDGGNAYFAGKIADVRAIKGSAVAPTAAPTSALTAVAGTSLLISGNGGVSDASSSSHSLTLNGDVTTALGSPYTSGNVIAFDGSGDYISVPSSNDVIMGSEDFTFETWFYHENASTSPWGRMVEAGAYTSAETWRVNQVGSTGQIAFQIGGPSPRQEIFSNAVLALQEWNHIAIVRNSNTITMYINGVAQSSTLSYTGSFTAGMTLIGQGDTNYWHGKLADIRLVKGTAIYTENFSVPTATLGDYPPPPVRYYKTEIIPPAPTVTFTGNATDSAELAIDDTISLNAAAAGMGYHSTSFTVGQPMIMEMHLWGAGGGGTKRSSNYTGGYGGYSTGRYTFVPGVEYQVVVGGGGEGGSQDPSSNTAYGALATGGGANEQSTGSEFDGGAGGGYTGVFISEVSQASALIIAGGGGGGSGDIGTGGAGGGLNGGNGSNGGRAGLGGSQTAGGSGSGGPGSALQGGTGLGVGAGGGGGYFGGAGGINSGPGAGGGGSGFISSELTDASTGGLDFNAPYRTDSAGLGGASGQNGVGGLLVLRRIS